MKKIILCLMLGIFLLAGVSAAQSLGEVTQYECIELTQICDCTYVNISSVMYPNRSTMALSNVEMEEDGTHYNYTFCSTETTGNYIVSGYGDPAGTKTIWTYDFDVTPMGKLGILIFLAAFAFAFAGLGIGLKIPPLGFIGGVLFILSGMYVMIYGLCDVANLYTRGIAISLLSLGAVFMIASGYEWIAE